MSKLFVRSIFKAAKKLNSTHTKITAFCWEPVWLNGKLSVPQKKVKRLFQLFADIKPKKTKGLLDELMLNKREITPFQRIRDEIKNSSEVRSFYKILKRVYANRPCMLGIVDDDAIRYRTKKNGLLSQYDQLIENFPHLEVASTGYYMTDPDEDFAELASRADLVARTAIAESLPNGVYLPEPNLFIKIDDKDALTKISFLRKGSDKGKGLEFLGLMENLGLNKGNVKGRVVMGKIGPILTSSPRVKIPQHMPAVLTSTKINNAKNLASLRIFCQSALNPKKGFAASVARATPTGTGSAKNTAKISKLYTAFDPIDYIKKTSNWHKIYDLFVENLLSMYKNMYKKRKEEPAYEPNFKLRAKRIIAKTHEETDEKKLTAELLEEKFNDLCDARTELTEKPPHLSKKQFRALLVAALNANLAVYTLLKSKIDEVPFIFPELYK